MNYVLGQNGIASLSRDVCPTLTPGPSLIRERGEADPLDLIAEGRHSIEAVCRESEMSILELAAHICSKQNIEALERVKQLHAIEREMLLGRLIPQALARLGELTDEVPAACANEVQACEVMRKACVELLRFGGLNTEKRHSGQVKPEGPRSRRNHREPITPASEAEVLEALEKLVCEHRVDEGVGVEGFDVFGGFTHADELDGDVEGVLDGDDDAAFGGAVELGEKDAGHVDGLLEFLSLGDGGLAGGGIEDQQHFVGGVGNLPGDHVSDLGELLHEVPLIMQTPGGVDEQDIRTSRDRGPGGVEGDGGGVRTLISLDEINPQSLRPDFELGDGPGSEGVGGGEENTAPLIAEGLGNLGDAGGLAGPVDARDENNRRDFGGGGKGAIHGGETRLEGCLEKVDRILAPGDFTGGEGLTQLLDDGDGRLHADVGLDEVILDVVDERAAQGLFLEKRVQTAGEGFAGAGESFANGGDGGGKKSHEVMLRSSLRIPGRGVPGIPDRGRIRELNQDLHLDLFRGGFLFRGGRGPPRRAFADRAYRVRR